MLALLSAGRLAASPSYYVHPGDLLWWLFYSLYPENFSEMTAVWVGAEQDLLGWALCPPTSDYMDVYIQPAIMDTPAARTMLDWTLHRRQALTLARGGNKLHCMWIAPQDEAKISWLETAGFTRQPSRTLVLSRSLAEPLPQPSLPEGFVLRPLAGEGEAAQRARASYAAFDSLLPFEQYLARLLAFMRSPAYQSQWNRVAATLDGEHAAFCTCWLDDQTRVGLFEPVGTHPAFQRRGLARALLADSLRQMQAAAMAHAMVCVSHDNPAALRLYTSLGFAPQETLYEYARPAALPADRTGNEG
jgi:ribosomal protein S18 acetylase RimI-like enzyme